VQLLSHNELFEDDMDEEDGTSALIALHTTEIAVLSRDVSPLSAIFIMDDQQMMMILSPLSKEKNNYFNYTATAA